MSHLLVCSLFLFLINVSSAKWDNKLEIAVNLNSLIRKVLANGELYHSPKTGIAYTGWIKEFHNNGSVKVLSQLKDGLKDGFITFWNINGLRIIEGHYVKGKREGTWTMWFDDGGSTIAEYLNGKLHGESSSFYTTGNIATIGKYLNGKKTGVWFDYNDAGLKFRETHYKKETEIRLEKYFNDDGRLWRSATYLDDKIHGFETHYGKQGEIFQRTPYKHGEKF